MLNGEPIGYVSRTLLLKRGRMVEEETDPGGREILANASQLGKGLGTKLV